MNKKRIIWLLKLVVVLAIAGFVAKQVYDQWGKVNESHLHVDWRFAPLALVAFTGVFLTSGCVWLWIARRMGDRSAPLPLLGAYTFSQMGKYVPGKVFLLLMRIDRTSRIGMTAEVCTVSTLLENVTYMISGGLVAALTLLVFAHDKPMYLLIILACLVPLCAAVHPKVFYFLVNKGLQKFKRPPVEKEHQLPLRDLLLSVLFFFPCWLFGGVALWASCRCLTPVPVQSLTGFPGAFSASVIGGMAVGISPGGLGPRELILGLLLDVYLPTKALIIAVGLQRLMQIGAEVLLGLTGAVVSARRKQTVPKDLIAVKN